MQETFTDQWRLVDEDELSFAYTADELVELNRRVWLRWVEELPADERPKSLLNVGCGVGMETMALQRVTGADEVFGIDLNLALLGRRPEFRGQPGVNFVVASLFDLPFEGESFELVYSQGVLHHTYSTVEAFNSIARCVTPGGRQFVWLYGKEDHLSRGGSKTRHAAEKVLRPLITRAPQRWRAAASSPASPPPPRPLPGHPAPRRGLGPRQHRARAARLALAALRPSPRAQRGGYVVRAGGLSRHRHAVAHRLRGAVRHPAVGSRHDRTAAGER